MVYDLEVASYCGLVTRQVELGFRRERDRIVSRNEMDDDHVQLARRRGWAAAYREWGNRGLGGFRGWCRNEGKAAADRFLSVP